MLYYLSLLSDHFTPLNVFRYVTFRAFLGAGTAFVLSLLLGRWIPGLNTALENVAIDGISLPIALGLLIMMSHWPVTPSPQFGSLDWTALIMSR